MSIGAMRERVSIQSPPTTPDGRGGVSGSWSTDATVWARVTPEQGREEEQAGRLEGQQRYTVRIRYYSGLTTKHRLLWGSTALQVRDIRNPDEHRRYMDLDCEAGVAT